MKIQINLTKEEAEHLASPHTFMDECTEACDVLYKVQKEISKKRKNKIKPRVSFWRNKKIKKPIRVNFYVRVKSSRKKKVHFLKR